MGTPVFAAAQTGGKDMVAMLFPCQATTTGSGKLILASRGPMFVNDPSRARSKPSLEILVMFAPVN